MPTSPAAAALHTPSTPYAGLTPEAVLDALDTVGLRGDGRLIQLNSYENRVYQVFLEDGTVVVPKFYRPGRWNDAQILEEHRFAAELVAAEVPVVAPLPLTSPGSTAPTTLARFDIATQHHRFSVCPRKSGRAPELEDPNTLEWLGRFIGRLHAVGQRQPFAHRLTLSIDSHGHAHRNWLSESGLIPPECLAAWQRAIDLALVECQRRLDAVGPYRAIRLHGDCHTGNVLWTEAGPHFVDLDDALMGPAVQDLWMLLSGDPAAAQTQLHALLAGYEDFMEFNWRELRLIEVLRTLRMIHHSAWIARRWADPAFPAAFPFFGTPAYWQEQTTRLLDQLEVLQEPPEHFGLPL